MTRLNNDIIIPAVDCKSMYAPWPNRENIMVFPSHFPDSMHNDITSSSISLPLSYQIIHVIEAKFFRNGIMLLVCYPPISFVLIRNAQQIGTGRVTRLSTVHVSTMYAQTIQPVQSSSSHSNQSMQHRYTSFL